MSAPSPPREPSSIIFALSAPIDRADVPALCTRLRVALEASDALFVVCDVGELTKPDAVTIDALARLQLTARRLGRQLRLRHASSELVALLAFMGLSSVVRLSAMSRLWAEPEEREEALGVQERVQRDDPAV